MGIVKPSFDDKRQVLGKVYPLNSPFTVILDISEVCNLKCNYCFRADNNESNWGYALRQDKMDWGVFVKAIEQIKEFDESVKQISLSHHGEPLSNRMLPEMVSYIKNEGIKSRVSIHTNATLLDLEYAKRLAESNIDRMVVSLQGLDSEAYKNTCGIRIDFEKLYSTLEYFYKCKTNTQVSIKIANTALNNGQDKLFYDMFLPISDRAYIEQIIPLWSSTESNTEKEVIKNKYGDSFERQECCPLIFNTIVVLPNGDVYPCTQLLSEEKLGNINEGSIKHFWNSTKRIELLKQQLEMRAGKLCQDCAIRTNSIYAKEDMIDEYRYDILERINSIYE